MKTKYLIIDCSSLIYASFYAFGSLSYNGKPTSIIYGFLSKVLKLAKEEKTEKLYFCWDHDEYKREKDYPQYKQNRKNKKKEFTESELIEYNSMVKQSIELYENVLPNIGFMNSFRQYGYESDDLMCVVAKDLSNHGEVIMVTSDNDMYQCLDYCTILNPSTMNKFSKEDFKKKYKVHPSQWPICKSIGGCKGDNVIGIVGVADPKKTTSKALKYIRGEISKGVIYEKIKSKEGEEIIKRNLPLVTLPYKPDEMKPIMFRRDKITKGKLIKIFDKYGFRSFLEFDNFKNWERTFLK